MAHEIVYKGQWVLRSDVCSAERDNVIMRKPRAGRRFLVEPLLYVRNK